jgi:hypothetical protein
VSIYSELLRIALDEDRDIGGRELSTDELVDQLRTCGTLLTLSRHERGAGERGAVEWTAHLMARDVVLVHLCDRLGIDQALTDPRAAPGESDRLLAVLASKGVDLGQAAAEAVGDGARV